MSQHELRQTRSMNDGAWLWVTKTVMFQVARKVGLTSLGVYCLLAALVDRAQRCHPSQDYLASTLGLSRSTVSRALMLLEASGLVRKDKNSRHHTSYTLLKTR
ncbi:MAG: helix-turn-helix domain-containing protein [Ignavibacteriae bacterium]|nr:helix-turn-helix domain-containing protein [Ignavibacteriota bacterium]